MVDQSAATFVHNRGISGLVHFLYGDQLACPRPSVRLRFQTTNQPMGIWHLQKQRRLLKGGKHSQVPQTNQIVVTAEVFVQWCISTSDRINGGSSEFQEKMIQAN